ncbi:hypothetical protein K458DRAFT_431499 [Lentithecium fluviatile CBS 122367]|uniref:Uncharacterized protein n=1 Tax=Lentithecium fluviatile CBS 122367 TaxID=1168545 RepID=A0A6G1J303_9PLEO|nr:hypothetical protein K458DRAFT_431499 [Lentithecium fluviatile CBS 122367]
MSSTSPIPTNIPIIAHKDPSALATISIPVIFGVLGTILAITSVTLAYLQLRHQYHIYGRYITGTLPRRASDNVVLLQDLEAQNAAWQSVTPTPHPLEQRIALSISRSPERTTQDVVEETVQEQRSQTQPFGEENVYTMDIPC